MKRSFLEEKFNGLELDEAKKKEIIDAIMNENGNDINAEKTKTETRNPTRNIRTCRTTQNC